MIAQKSSVSHIAWQGIEDIVRRAVLAFHENGVAVNKQRADYEIQKFSNSLILMNKDELLPGELLPKSLEYQSDRKIGRMESTSDFSAQTEVSFKTEESGAPVERVDPLTYSGPPPSPSQERRINLPHELDHGSIFPKR